MPGPKIAVRPADDADRKLAARRLRARRVRRGEAAITVSLAPMIDMTFLFLIFFLVTTTFERAEGVLSADMPREQGQPGTALPLSPIVVRLSPAGPENADVSITVDRFEDPPQNLDALPDFLRQVHQLPGFDADTPVVIVADDTVRWDHVVGCWNAALRAGCTRIAFAEP